MNSESKKILLFIPILLVVIVIAGYFIRKDKLDSFKENGVETVATVADLKKNTAITSKKNHRRYDYTLQVTFFTVSQDSNTEKDAKAISKDEDGKYKFNLKPSKSGDFVMTDIGITASQFGKLKKGQRVEILYLKNDPKQAILKEELE